MKNFNLGVIAVAFALVLSSCTTNETPIEEQTTTNLLNSYTVKRDASGAYSLDYNLAGDVASEVVKDSKTNANEIYLYSSDDNTKRSYSEDLAIDKNQLKVGFVDTNTDRKSNITILDNDIVLARGNDEDDLLASYSVTGNEDGTYDVVFKVDDNVGVDFVYNEDQDVYEIHLEEGNGTAELDFARTFTKEEGVDLNIDFVNHFDAASRGIASRETFSKKPRIIVDLN